MANTESTYDAQLTLVQSAITSALTNPKPNYKVGSVSYSHADYIKMLMATQEKIVHMLQKVPAEQWDTINASVNVFGQDLADYINENED